MKMVFPQKTGPFKMLILAKEWLKKIWKKRVLGEISRIYRNKKPLINQLLRVINYL
jgi:hypothetical protein